MARLRIKASFGFNSDARHAHTAFAKHFAGIVNRYLMDQPTEQHTYESAFTELQQIVQELQGEMVGIDDLALKIARAQELIRFCRERLREVETEVGKIVE